MELARCQPLPGARIGLPEKHHPVDDVVKLDLAYSGLTGSIPLEMCWLRNLRSVNLQGNQLKHQIPAQIGDLTNLTYLSLRTVRAEARAMIAMDVE